MIVTVGKTALNAVLGTTVALLLIAVVDRSFDPIWDEYAELISLDTDSVVLHLHGNKVRSLSLVSPPIVNGFAIDEDGRRRLVEYTPISGQRPVTYKKGWTDFGWWEFRDSSPNPRAITKVEIDVMYECITGRCRFTLGPIPVD